MEQVYLYFIFENKRYSLPMSTNILAKMSENVVKQFWMHHQYQIISKVNSNDVEQFIQFLLTDEMPDSVTEGFTLLSSEILIKVNDFLIKQLKDSNIKDKSSIVQEISQKLDQYLLFNGEELLSCPIQVLVPIFSNANLNNHEFAYRLIVSYFERTNKMDIFILLDYLSISKLNKESINDCISKRKERFNYIPNFSPSFFENIEYNQSMMNKKIIENQNDNNAKFDTILAKINSLENIICQQKDIIEDQKKRINDIENNNQTKIKQLMESNSKLEQIISEQKEKLSNLENEIKTINKTMQSIKQKIETICNEQQLKYANKLSISGNTINLTNNKGNVISTASIPSVIEKFNFGTNTGCLQLSNHLLIQWGRYIPSNWYGDGIIINFPIQFKTKPFMAVTGGGGADFHPCAENVTIKSFTTGYDHQTPTSWIAIGSI